MERETKAAPVAPLPHETQPCAVCDAPPADQGDGRMGAVEPPAGWAGEPVPICDDCNGADDAAYERAVAIGRARFWVGPKMIAACAGSVWRDWGPGDAVVLMREPGTWWQGAQYGEVVTAERGSGHTKGTVRVQWPDGIRVHRPRDLVEKTNPYEED